LNEEYETAKKKRKALDSLLDSGRISQSTHDLFNMEIAEAITEIERQQKALLQKMNAKMVELEEQIKTLEILLANFEIQHVVGEVDEEVYQREINVLSIGLETSRQELANVREAVEQLSSGNVLTEQETEPQVVENVLPQEKGKQKTTVEYVEVSETGTSEDQQKELENDVELESPETSVKGEEKQKA
jgi:hypothetical protein